MTWNEKNRDLRKPPTPQPEPSPLHDCVACGASIRWALASCFDCNAPLVEEARGRFLNFT